MVQKSNSQRKETDFLGDVWLDSDLLYGVQTYRARENFNLSDNALNHFPKLIIALAYIKKACAKSNHQLGDLNDDKYQAICKAADELIEGKHHDAFIVDLIQGGAGTSTNMNANEVIANLGLLSMGHQTGDYQFLHPNDDVNKSQSTNDVYPSAIRLAILLSHPGLVDALRSLISAFNKKADEFDSIIKMGRTQLQDAVPMSLGQEFRAFATTLSEDVERIADLSELLKEINLGGTAIGTGINARAQFGKIAVQKLSEMTDIRFVQSADLVEASSDMGAFVLFSSVLKRLAIKLSKISNDLRLLSMGPRAGLSEINLPPRQPGSSIMPGKVNPVIPEAVSQVAYMVIGNDLSITMAAEAGQLQLNAMEPLIAYSILDSIRLLARCMNMLEQRCVEGITANEQQCRDMVEHSIGIITVLNPYIGYENASRIAKQAHATGQNVLDIVRKENLLDEQKLAAITQPENMLSSHSKLN